MLIMARDGCECVIRSRLPAFAFNINNESGEGTRKSNEILSTRHRLASGLNTNDE